MKNRQKQLEALSKMADKIRENRNSLQNKGSTSANNSQKDKKLTMHMHVLNLSKVLIDRKVTWHPLRENFNVCAPEETIFYSLVEGRGELIMFGGIQRDIQTMQRGLDLRSHIVSNNLHIISPRRYNLG